MPSGGDLVLGVVIAFLAALAAAYAVDGGLRSNWLYLITAIGALAVLAGVAGQQSFGADVAAGGTKSQGVPTAWEAGVSLPVIGIRVSPVLVGGLLVALAGLSLVLFFEPVAVEQRESPELPPLDADDTA